MTPILLDITVHLDDLGGLVDVLIVLNYDALLYDMLLSANLQRKSK